ncbi:MAG TPA: MFS transporter [Streptosporangiaceae bacterium]|nr:MFS transporter [Streptosporangiaceae bacterium]
MADARTPTNPPPAPAWGAGATTPAAASSPTLKATGPLRQNLRFQALWIGSTSSTLGVAVADIAYPLLILMITGSPAKAGLFAAVQTIGMLAAGLPAGSLADRYDPRSIVLVAETCRVVVTVAVVLALAMGWLSLPLLLAAAALLGIGYAACSAARMLLLRSVVPGEQLTAALTQDQVRTNGAGIVGPALGGALYSLRVLAHAVPFVFTAAAFVIGMVTTAFLPRRAKGQPQDSQDEDQPPAAADQGGMLAGVRVLWGQPMLRASVILIMIVNTLGAGLDLVIIVLLHHQSVPSAQIGIVLGVGGAGGIAGIGFVRILHRLRPGVMLLAVCLGFTVVIALLAVPFGPWWVAGLVFIAMLGIPAIQVAVDILVIRQAPAAQRGRVIAALMTLIGLGMPAGLVGCGLLLQYVPAQAAMLTLAAILAAGVAYSATKREMWHALWPAN